MMELVLKKNIPPAYLKDSTAPMPHAAATKAARGSVWPSANISSKHMGKLFMCAARLKWELLLGLLWIPGKCSVKDLGLRALDRLIG